MSNMLRHTPPQYPPLNDDTERNRARALAPMTPAEAQAKADALLTQEFRNVYGEPYTPAQEPTPRTFNEGVPKQFAPGELAASMQSACDDFAERARAASAALEPPRARSDDPETSKSAAAFIKPRTQALHVAVRKALADRITGKYPRPGLTTREIAEATGIDWGSITPRMLPLEILGHVQRGPKRDTPAHPRPALTWHLTDKGWNEYVLETARNRAQPPQTGAGSNATAKPGTPLAKIGERST